MNPLLGMLLIIVASLLGGMPLPVQESPAVAAPGDDLAAIRERGVLRLITRYSPNTYFLHRGEPMGFEYDLAKRFAKRLGVGLEVLVPPPPEDPLDWLLRGDGDLVGASLMRKDMSVQGVALSQSYKRVSRVVLVRDDCDSIRTPEDLVGRKVEVAEGGRYYWMLRALELRLGGMIDIECAPAEREPELIVADVSRGLAEATIADMDVAMLAMEFHGNLKVACELESPKAVGWGIRADAPELLAEANRYLEETRGSSFFNSIRRQYYETRGNRSWFFDPVLAARQGGVLSRYDQQIRKYANAFGLDWLLVAALMYEESRFDPSATSAAGALGLLQIMPGTASAMGVADATDPEQNISAGVRYLKYQCDLFEDAPDAEDQVRLALASYTIGAGHVQDAQRLASARGLDPNDWQSVADALRLLSLPEYYRHAEFGYCRGDEVVGHVEEVIRRWEIYGEYLERRGVSESGQALSAAEAQAQNGEPG